MILKPATTFDEQVRLIKDKGFQVSDEQECLEFLRQVNYYRLSAYFIPFKRTDSTHDSKIPFETIKRIYEFDSHLRVFLFQIIEEIEIFLRTRLAYFSAHQYGAVGYLDPNHFSNKHNHEKYIKRIGQCIEENGKTLVVKHHQQHYDGQFPIWVMIEFFSMGMLSYFYNDLKTPDQKVLAQELCQTSPKYMTGWLRCLTDLRNQCAHYAKFYNWIFSSLPKLPKDLAFTPNRKLFTQMLMLKYLYPNKSRWNKIIVPRLGTLIEEYQQEISLTHIGFPKNWEELLSALCKEITL